MKEIKFTIEGTSPFLMHSDVTANPLHHFSKELKKHNKRNKTDEDYLNISKVEFEASCYYRTGWYIPGQNIESMLLASAKHFKLGTTIKQALLITDDAEFNFPDSDLTPMILFEKKQYVDQRTVKVGTQKIIRTRPLFNTWKVTFSCLLDEYKLNQEELIRIVENAGSYVGLGDYRPRFGRFELIKNNQA
ncbi:MAG: hypothetical protein Q8J88_01150 [Bacteroidales bacterium]|nr:hypothetical protein [Bacteroidales bacterium]